MGLFARRTVDPPQTEERYSGPALINYLNAFTSYGMSSTSVGTAQALRTSAFWACQRVLAGSVSNLPIDVIRKDGDTRRKVDPLPSLIAEPSAMVERDVWVHQLVTSMYDDGNAWGMITGFDQRGHPTFIETINPSVVTNRRLEDGVPTVTVSGEDHHLFPVGLVWHVPGPMVQAGSPFGLSPREFASGALDATIAAQQFGTGFLSGGGIPSALLKLIGADPTDTQSEGAKSAFKRAAENRDLVVMGGSWEYEKIQVDPNESQFLELQRFIIEDVCRFMGVPPSMVYGAVSGQSVTYANVSQADPPSHCSRGARLFFISRLVT